MLLCYNIIFSNSRAKISCWYIINPSLRLREVSPTSCVFRLKSWKLRNSFAFRSPMFQRCASLLGNLSNVDNRCCKIDLSRVCHLEITYHLCQRQKQGTRDTVTFIFSATNNSQKTNGKILNKQDVVEVKLFQQHEAVLDVLCLANLNNEYPGNLEVKFISVE